MRALLVLLAIACLPAAGLHADTIRLPLAKPVAEIEIPGDWSPDVSEKGVEAVSPDETVYLAIGHVAQGEVGEFLDNALAYLKNHGVEVDKESITQEDLKLNGMEAVDVNWLGTDSDGPCAGKLDLFGITETDGLMMLYWAAPDAIRANAEALAGIIASIRPAGSAPSP